MATVVVACPTVRAYRLNTAQYLTTIQAVEYLAGGGGGQDLQDAAGKGEKITIADRVRAITDRHGRIVVLITHNTDISDAWDREADDPRFFLEFSPNGYAFGLNVVLYAMTH